MQTALITGACGFCASHLARALAAEGGVRVVGADLRANPPDAIPFDDYVTADLARAVDTAAIIRQVRPDLVFHLAGLVRGDTDDLYRVNLLGGVHLLECVRETVPQARVLVVGSAAEYGHAPATDMPLTEDHPCRPSGAYAVSKHALCLAAQDFALHRGVKVVVARPFNIVGAGVPASLVVGAILDRAKQVLASDGPPVVSIGNLDSQRDFVAVEDVVDGYVRLIRGEHWGEVFNLCSGVPVAIRDVVQTLLSHSDRPIEYRVNPRLVNPTDTAVIFGSWERARRACGFTPTISIEESLGNAWRYVMSEGK